MLHKINKRAVETTALVVGRLKGETTLFNVHFCRQDSPVTMIVSKRKKKSILFAKLFL